MVLATNEISSTLRHRLIYNAVSSRYYASVRQVGWLFAIYISERFPEVSEYGLKLEVRLAAVEKDRFTGLG